MQSGKQKLTIPVTFNPVTYERHILPAFFGGTEIGGDGFVSSVPSVQLVYFVNVDNKRMEKR